MGNRADGVRSAGIDPAVAELLNRKVAQYNRPSFIERDPISIPHRFTHRQDIEIMGFWAAVLAWGQRPVILKKAAELIERMDGAPADFVRNHQPGDLKRFLDFKHRTFNATDALYFLHFFRHYYQQHDTLEDAFLPTPDGVAGTDNVVKPTTSGSSSARGNRVTASAGANPEAPPGAAAVTDVVSVTTLPTVERHLTQFHDRFCCDPFFPDRTRKHIATPARNASCKRLLMFLRWMVRHDNAGVDFGLWTRIRPAQLVMPIDVHVGRVARTLGLLHRPQTDWRAALDLTTTLAQLDPTDPVRYDFALFGLGVEGEL